MAMVHRLCPTIGLTPIPSVPPAEIGMIVDGKTAQKLTQTTQWIYQRGLDKLQTRAVWSFTDIPVRFQRNDYHNGFPVSSWISWGHLSKFWHCHRLPRSGGSSQKEPQISKQNPTPPTPKPHKTWVLLPLPENPSFLPSSTVGRQTTSNFVVLQTVSDLGCRAGDSWRRRTARTLEKVFPRQVGQIPCPSFLDGYLAY